LPGVAVELVPWVGEGVTRTVGVPAGGGESVVAVFGDALVLGATVGVATLDVAVAEEVDSAATGDGVAVGSDTAWAQAMSSNVVNATRKNQRAIAPPDTTLVPVTTSIPPTSD
jgi:hypothetical protein